MGGFTSLMAMEGGLVYRGLTLPLLHRLVPQVAAAFIAASLETRSEVAS